MYILAGETASATANTYQMTANGTNDMCACYCLTNIHIIVPCLYFYLTVEPPTLPELLRLKIYQDVGANYSTFGILILNDITGSRISSLKSECQGIPERVMLRILQEWMEGKGLPVTWESLIKTLRDTGLSAVAEQIQVARLS